VKVEEELDLVVDQAMDKYSLLLEQAAVSDILDTKVELDIEEAVE